MIRTAWISLSRTGPSRLGFGGQLLLPVRFSCGSRLWRRAALAEPSGTHDIGFLAKHRAGTAEFRWGVSGIAIRCRMCASSRSSTNRTLARNAALKARIGALFGVSASDFGRGADFRGRQKTDSRPNPHPERCFSGPQSAGRISGRQPLGIRLSYPLGHTQSVRPNPTHQGPCPPNISNHAPSGLRAGHARLLGRPSMEDARRRPRRSLRDPGELRNRPKVAEWLPQSRRTLAPGADLRPQTRPKLADSG